MSGTREFEYPQARRQDLTEEILGRRVSDPYRWMEDGRPRAGGRLAAQAGLFAASASRVAGA